MAISRIRSPWVKRIRGRKQPPELLSLYRVGMVVNVQ
jgi:hypothetical protein